MAKLKRRPDGRVVQTVTDPRTGKRIFFYGQTEREVTRKIFEYTEQAKIGRNFKVVADEWWNEAEPNLAYQSIKTYRPAFRRAVDEFGNRSIRDIRPRDISLFLKKLAKGGKASKTLSNQRLIVNLIMDYAVLENDIEVNPCSSVRMPEAKKSTRSAASGRDEQIVKESAHVWIFPYIAIMTGMRKGEILALQWKDIDFDRNIISVSKSVYHEGDRPYVKEPKTQAGYRTVPLLEPLKKVFEGISTRDPEAYIVSDDGTKPLTNRRFITLMSHFKEKTGVQCTAHQLRHSFATIAFECGVPVKSVQEILGHKQLSTTMDIYTDFRQQSVNEAADILNKKWQSSTK